MPSNSNLKFIGVILFLIGLGFIFVNFSSPHIVLVQTSVQVPHQVTVPNESQAGSKSDFILENNQYWYFYNVTVSAGQTFKMTWSSDTSLTAYIFTQNQYNNWQSNSLGFSINYQATGSGKSGSLTYDVKDTDEYFAVLKNGGGLIGGATAQVYQFTISRISYTAKTEYTPETQTVQQNDNLYLYLGFIFIILGICVFSILQKVFPTATKNGAQSGKENSEAV